VYIGHGSHIVQWGVQGARGAGPDRHCFRLVFACGCGMRMQRPRHGVRPRACASCMASSPASRTAAASGRRLRPLLARCPAGGRGPWGCGQPHGRGAPFGTCAHAGPVSRHRARHLRGTRALHLAPLPPLAASHPVWPRRPPAPSRLPLRARFTLRAARPTQRHRTPTAHTIGILPEPPSHPKVRGRGGTADARACAASSVRRLPARCGAARHTARTRAREEQESASSAHDD